MPWYKLARPDGWDFYTGKTINYRAALGQVVRCPRYLAQAVSGGGVHLSHDPNECFQGAHIPCSAYLVEPVEGLLTIDATNSKAQSVRVIREIDDLDALLGWDYTGLLAFLATIPTVPWFTPDGAPEPDWRVFPLRRAARVAAGRAARVAARAAAGRMALAVALRMAKGAAWEAVGRVAREAVEQAAGRAVREAAGRAGRQAVYWAAGRAAGESAWEVTVEAAWDAAWRAMLYVCTPRSLLAQHADFLCARWQVWEKGYGLLGEVNGTLFVYEHI